MTVEAKGWKGKANGELLAAAQHDFDALLTIDRGIPHQQNLSGLDLAIIVLRVRGNSLRAIAPLVDEIKDALREALREARAGAVVEVEGAR